MAKKDSTFSLPTSNMVPALFTMITSSLTKSKRAQLVEPIRVLAEYLADAHDWLLKTKDR
jgi:hypothetical protein